MLENHPLFLSVFACIACVVVASWELAPQLNELIQLAPFPDDLYRLKVVALVVATIFGTFTWDRLCTMVFAPSVFSAMRAEAARTTLKDVQVRDILGGVWDDRWGWLGDTYMCV